MNQFQKFMSEHGLGLGMKIERYEVSIYQGGDCIQMKVNSTRLEAVMQSALDSDCQVHIKKISG